MGMKFNSVAMNRDGLMTTSGLTAADRDALNAQIKKLDAQIVQKEQELEKAGQLEEFAVAKELNALRKERDDLASLFALDIVLAQHEIRKEIPAQQCTFSKSFLAFLYAKTAKIFRVDNPVASVTWSPDGIKLAIASGNDAKILNVNTKTQIGPDLHHNGIVDSVAWSPDGTKLATGSWDHTAKTWDVATGMQIGQDLQHDGSVYAVAWSPDGTKLATAGSKGMKIFDITTGQMIRQLRAFGASSVAWSSDGTKIVLGFIVHRVVKITGNMVGFPINSTREYWSGAYIYDAITIPGRQIGPELHTRGVTSVAWDPDGRELATGSYDKTARIWYVHNGRQVGPDLRHTGTVNSVAWSLDGSKLATGSADHTAKIWDVTTNAQIGPDLQHPSAVSSVAWNSNGNIATGCRDRTVRIWDLKTIPDFLSTLNIDQCELLQAFEMMATRERLGKPLMPIEATEDQWYTFATFPKAVRDALRQYIKEPSRENPPVLEESRRREMEERISKRLEELWEREAQQK